ncbi:MULTISPECIES: FtsX-like permease family protein [Kitasatospora]|uniref:Putative membrane protein n=1 Tax=Kitasatospora setae (strain ATCC 33774 / DSM 43861 / JCM 3304 / KCC A-0304 / NBRC 14216 / KM-6054) TaxID=452652 RepID=E4NJA3_KITSK|nr:MULTISPECIES: FtsX-like permease family protein [Kitasatospora]BAJ33051.1 putative membrane protein [Kitasatospora setae KM-6054]
MSNGLARAAVRFRPASFAGTFLALLFASAIVTACGVLLQTGLTASVQPSRYADVPVVVAADQQVKVEVARGEDRETVAQPLPERARLDAALTTTVASLPGVAQALPDSAFPVSVASAPSSSSASSAGSTSAPSDLPGLTGRGWAALGIGPGERLAEGRAPADGELVLDAASARAAHLSPGDSVTVATPAGSASYRVSGLAEARPGSATAWFSDRTADRISGHPGRIDAIAVRPAAGTDPRALAAELRHSLDGRAQVSTGLQRGTVEQPALHEARAMLTALGASFGGVATMTAVFVVVSTVALATGQRAREFALLRTIGATPRQIRRSIAAEAVLVAPLAAAVGVLPGLALARWWFGELVARAAVPADVVLGVGPLPVLAAVAACTVTALAAGWFAARRSARMRPAQALGEANTGPGCPGPVRTVTGAVFTAGAVAFAVVAANLTGAAAANTALGVVLCFLVSVALLGPWLVRGAVGLVGVLLRAGGAPASLAADNARASSRRLASATVPIVMVTAFCGTLVFLQSSLQHTAAEHVRQGLTADQVVSAQAGRPGLDAGTVERASQLPGVAAAVGLRPTGLVYQQSDVLATATALGVEGDPAALPSVLDLGVRSGSLADLSRSADTVALDATLADSLGVRVGDRAPLWLGDGHKAEPTVVATYSRGLGLGEALLPGATVAAHSDSPYLARLLVSRAPGADRAATAEALSGLAPGGLTVTDRQGYAAQADRQRELSGWANNVMAGVLAGFAALAAANTLVMTVLDRRREIALLRLAGTTRRQVRAMLRWEALLIALIGLATGTAIAWTTLTPITRALTSASPYVPLGTALPLAAGAALLCLAATALPGRALLRSRPTATR